MNDTFKTKYPDVRIEIMMALLNQSKISLAAIEILASFLHDIKHLEIENLTIDDEAWESYLYNTFINQKKLRNDGESIPATDFPPA